MFLFNSDSDPTIFDFKRKIIEYSDEIGIQDRSSKIGSHNLIGTVMVRCLNTDDDYRIVGLGIQQLPGCGCWSDIIIEIEKIEE